MHRFRSMLTLPSGNTAEISADTLAEFEKARELAIEVDGHFETALAVVVDLDAVVVPMTEVFGPVAAGLVTPRPRLTLVDGGAE